MKKNWQPGTKDWTLVIMTRLTMIGAQTLCNLRSVRLRTLCNLRSVRLRRRNLGVRGVRTGVTKMK